MKHPVLIKKDYTIYFEYVDDFIVVHCDVPKWTKTVMKKLLLDSYYLFSIQEKLIFACVDKENIKLMKFSRMHGFDLVEEEVTTADGNKMLFQWKGI